LLRLIPRSIATLGSLLLLLPLASLPPQAQAQTPREAPIFNRFAAALERPASRQALVEVPIAIQVQGDPDARIRENVGVSYVVSHQPRNRVYVSTGFTYGRQEWEPSNPTLADVKVYQLDITQILNFRIRNAAVISVGLGLGIMDGIVLFGDGRFKHRLEPYIPFQLGLGLPVGERFLVTLKLAESPFWGEGTVISHTRALIGLGYDY
jgi:hypothetical protein